jgi:hypothetical protein
LYHWFSFNIFLLFILSFLKYISHVFYLAPFIQFLRPLRKTANSDYYLRNVCRHETTRLPLDGFSWNLIFFE